MSLQPAPGLKFAQYELLAKLGAGGMGEVWRARDVSLGRDVAIKFLAQRALADPNRLARFEREARAASALNHPNIVTVHEIGREEEVPYIAMEMIQGRALRDFLGGRALHLRRVLEITCQVADGLARAHAAGIVHRDLKPDNVMVKDDGLVKILDFGLAKLVDPVTDLEGDTESFSPPPLDGAAPPKTREGVVLGTVGYMSPEQARGREIDHRSDQFSLGSILYELLSGRRPFQKSNSVETLVAIISEEPAPLPDVPGPLRWIMDRLHAKDPEQRYASTLDLARELRNVRDHLEEIRRFTSSARPPLQPDQRRWRTIRRALTASGVVVLVAALYWIGNPRGPAQVGHVAVLPFKYVGDNPKGEVLCQGLAEVLNTKLTQLEQFQGALTVVPSSEVASAGTTTPSAARRTFGATLVITGSIQDRGGRLRAHASLIDAESLRQVRSVEVDEAAGELFGLEDRLVERVIEMLRLRPGAGAQDVLAAGQTTVSDAYSAYLEARALLLRYEKPGNLETAIALLKQAVVLDPRYALAHASLGEAYWRQYEQTRRTELVGLAQASCERALALNQRLAPVLVTVGMIERGTGRAREALDHLDKALAVDPVSADAHRERARALEDAGEFAAAEQAYRKAVELRPLHWAAYNQLGGFLRVRGRNAEAHDAFLKVTELAPDSVPGWNNLGSVEFAQGRLEEARRAWEASARIAPSATAYSNLGTLAFSQARYGDAARSLEQAVRLRESDYRVWRNLAAAYYWAPGEREKARAAFEKALELGQRERGVTPRDGRLLGRLADCYANLDLPREARALLADALSLAPRDASVMFMAGLTYERLGERELALRWISSALEAGHPRREVDTSPSLAGLRADPRFKAAAKK